MRNTRRPGKRRLKRADQEQKIQLARIIGQVAETSWRVINLILLINDRLN